MQCSVTRGFPIIETWLYLVVLIPFLYHILLGVHWHSFSKTVPATDDTELISFSSGLEEVISFSVRVVGEIQGVRPNDSAAVDAWK